MNELIAKRYAKALEEIIDDAKLPKAVEVLKSISSIYAQKQSRQILDSPLLSQEERYALFIEPLKGKIDEALLHLLEVMNEKGRLSLLPELADILDKELKRLSQRYSGTIEADEKLSKEKIKSLESVLSRYSGATIVLKQSSRDYDGLKVSVEDLGLELNLSKTRIKSELLDFIQRAL